MDVFERQKRAEWICSHLHFQRFERCEYIKKQAPTGSVLGGCCLVHRLGSSSRSVLSEGGEAYKACCANQSLAIKIAPLSEAELTLLEHPWGKGGLCYSAFTEALCNELSTCLVLTARCPHLPVMYNIGLCGLFPYSNTGVSGRDYSSSYPETWKRIQQKCAHHQISSTAPKWKDIQEHASLLKRRGVKDALPALLLFCELAQGTAVDWFKMKRRSEIQWFCMLFQVLVGLRAMNYHFGVVHHDMRGENVLYHRNGASTPRNRSLCDYVHYVVDGQSYYMPDYGYVFVLWDYGMASSSRGKRLPNDADARCKERHASDRSCLEQQHQENSATDVYRFAAWILDTLATNYPVEARWIPGEVMIWLAKAITNEWTPKKALRQLPDWLQTAPAGRALMTRSFNVTESLNPSMVRAELRPLLRRRKTHLH